RAGALSSIGSSPGHRAVPRSRGSHLLAALPFVLLGFHALASLLIVFPVFYHLPPGCKKMNRTRSVLSRKSGEAWRDHVRHRSLGTRRHIASATQRAGIYVHSSAPRGESQRGQQEIP